MSRTAKPPVREVIGDDLGAFFDQRREPRDLLQALRLLGFTARSLQEITGAGSRETVYAWANGRSLPAAEHAQRLEMLREVMAVVGKVESEPGVVWMILNGWPGKLEIGGPTVIDLLEQGDEGGAKQALEAVEELAGVAGLVDSH